MTEYFKWLVTLVRGNSYTRLLYLLYQTEYIWYLVLDENRAKGGLTLRDRFAYQEGINLDDVRDGPCSVLEMLIVLAERMSEQNDEEMGHNFWILIRNLDIKESDDEIDENRVKFLIRSWLSREYLPNGKGGLFKLKYYPGDVRNLDTYSQMNAWIEEHYPHKNIFE